MMATGTSTGRRPFEVPSYWTRPQLELKNYPKTDSGNAERLIARHGSDLLYVDAWKSWLIWDGTCWRRDEELIIERLAIETIRATQVAISAMDDTTKPQPASTRRLGCL